MYVHVCILVSLMHGRPSLCRSVQENSWMGTRFYPVWKRPCQLMKHPNHTKEKMVSTNMNDYKRQDIVDKSSQQTSDTSHTFRTKAHARLRAHTYVRMHARTCMHARTHARTHMRTHTYRYIYTHLDYNSCPNLDMIVLATNKKTVYAYVYMYLCMYVCMYVCLYACMHVCMYVCMYACIHV